MVIAEALTLEDALLIIAHRAQLMAAKCDIGKSTMLACNVSAASIEYILRQDASVFQVTVACDNTFKDTVVAGPVEQITQLAQLLKDRGIRCKKLDVSLGFHSSALDLILDDLEEKCKNIHFSTPKIPFGSCFEGRLVQKGDLHTRYPVQQTRSRVRFTELIISLAEKDEFSTPTFIEIGPNPITLPMIRTGFPDEKSLFLPSLMKGQDSWQTVSGTLQQLSSRYDSIKWRRVFDGCDARVIDLPQYPFQTHELYIPFQEPDVKTELVSPPKMVKPEMFHLLQGAVDGDVVSGKSTSIFNARLDTLAPYIQGHSVGGFPLCPASVYHEMVLEAMEFESDSTTDSVALASNIAFGHPLVYSDETKDVKLSLKLSKPSSPEGTGTFEFTLPEGSDAETVVCSGQTSRKSYPESVTYLARKAAYAKRQMKYLHRNQNQTNILHRKVIYETIFPRVVAYSEPYQAIKELNVAETELHAYGTFEISASDLKGGVFSPVFVDVLLHAAGFVANSHAKPTDAFICSKVESTVLLHRDIKPNDTFIIYCSLLECATGELLGEAFAMTLDGKAVASVEGMHFKRLNLKAFTSHLSRQLGQTPTLPAPRSTPKAKPIQSNRTSTAPKGPNLWTAVIELISKISEQTPDVITPGKKLSDLGIDSLMQIELSSSLKALFPNLDPNVLMNLDTISEIETYITKAVTASSSVAFASDPMDKSTSSPGESDDESSILLSGKTTPQTELNTPGDTTELLIQIVAEICGFALCAVHQDMALEALGMDSLMAIEFQESIQRVFDRSITQETLPNLTIRELSARLSMPVLDSLISENPNLLRKKGMITQAPVEHDNERFIIQLQQGPEFLPPLILFHDGSGMIEKYKLLESIGCTTFGVKNPQLTAQSHWAQSIEQMAIRYADSIATMIQGKQVVLGGKYMNIRPIVQLSKVDRLVIWRRACP